MKTITFSSIKGGTGKSSLTILSANLLASRGYRVLVIDLDVQNSTTFYYLDQAEDVEQRNIARALQTQHLALNILASNKQNIDLIGSCFELVDLRAITEKRLVHLLPEVSTFYDYCIIDSAPTYDNLVLNAINAADLIITPVAQAQFDYKSALFLSTKLKGETDKIPSWRLVFNSFKPVTTENSLAAQYVALFESSFANILPVRIPYSTFVRQAIDMGVGITPSKAKRKLYDSLHAFVDSICSELSTLRS
jgi:chromosome partitioning protein